MTSVLGYTSCCVERRRCSATHHLSLWSPSSWYLSLRPILATVRFRSSGMHATFDDHIVKTSLHGYLEHRDRQGCAALGVEDEGLVAWGHLCTSVSLVNSHAQHSSHERGGNMACKDTKAEDNIAMRLHTDDRTASVHLTLGHGICGGARTSGMVCLLDPRAISTVIECHSDLSTCRLPQAICAV